MKKLYSVLLILFFIVSQANSSVCKREVNENNNGACELELEYDASTDSWELTSARCQMFKKNVYDHYECMLLAIPLPNPDVPAIHEA